MLLSSTAAPPATATCARRRRADLAGTAMYTAVAFSKYPVCETPLDERFEQLDRY